MSLARVVGPMAWANLKGQRLQAALIAVTVAACGALLTIGLAAQSASGGAFDHLWRATNGPDLWLYLDSRKVEPRRVDDAMAQTPGVARWSGPFPQARIVPAEVTENGFGSGFYLRDWPTDPSVLSYPLLVAGMAPIPGQRDVIVLDRNLAAVARIKLGATFRVSTPTGLVGLRVIGLDASAEQCPYPLCSPQPVYAAPGGLAALGLMPSAASGQYAVAVRATHSGGSQLDRLRDAITARLPAGAVAYASLEPVTRQFAQFGYAAQSGLLLLFALVAACTAGLLMVVAIGAAVRADSRRTGLLKAVGFSSAQLRVTALTEYVVIAVLGAVAGGVVGALLAPHLLGPVTGQFGAGGPAIPWNNAAVAVAGIAMFTSLIVLGGVRRAVRLSPVAALRSDPQGNQAATALFPGPVVLARALGDIVAGRGRSLLTAASIALAAGGLVMAALFAGSMDQFLHTGLGFDGARTGDLIAIGPNRQGDLAAIRSEAGVVGVVREDNASFSLVGSTKTLNLRLRDGDTAVLPQSLVQGRPLHGPGELVVGYGLARTHHLVVGQHLSVVVAGTARQFEIVGVNREVDNLGQMATTLPESVPDFANGSAPRQYLIRLRAGMPSAAMIRSIRGATGDLVNPAVVGISTLPPLIGSIIPVTRSLAAALALLTALGVSNSIFLAVQDRRREFGLIRALGMDQGQVLETTLTGVVLLAVAACLVAVPLAILVGRIGLGAVMGQVGVGHLAPPVTPTVLAVFPLVVAVAVVGAVGPAWSASRTSVVGVLRAD